MTTVLDRFARQVAARPAAIALESGDTRLSYAALDDRANGLAWHLQDTGVVPGTLVGVLLDRSVDLVVALLAILKAGAGYVPLDPSYPQARLDQMLADSRVTVVVASEDTGTLVPDGRVVTVDDARDARSPRTAPDIRVAPEDLAYAMYTSGSTGTPKAVLIEHRNIVNLALTADYVPLGENTCLLQLAPVSFDAATFEIWGALLNGGRLVLASPRANSTADLGEVIRTHGVNTLWLTSALFERVVDDDLSALAPVTHLLTGGDVVSPGHLRAALRARPGRVVVNGYGPTETTTFACCHVMTDPDAVEAPVPIGHAIPNVTAFVVGEDGRPVPDGERGELWIGGAGVGRGYLHRPELTAERFRPDPSGDGLVYRSGDLVVRRPDGVLEFHGRIDDQVKIRGYRIEPAEIEAELGEHPDVKQTVVVAAQAPAGDRRLVAYVVPANGEPPAGRQLRRFLADRLPPHQIPSLFLPLPELPVTANGKVDRRALPSPGWANTKRTT